MSERGFTLIELLIAVAIGSIVILALGGFYLSAVRFSTAGTAQADRQRPGPARPRRDRAPVPPGLERVRRPGLDVPASGNYPRPVGAEAQSRHRPRGLS